ncbi:MAG: ATP-dependent helicase, partial [Candidatus Cloacimonetes bacterium]|nr:ATP-dependent helicase [Candidatus Cloacimonadota bacterium]
MTDSFDFTKYKDNPEAVRLLSSLNDQQKKAVVANGKPLVVFAGAGSGKTRVITTKIVWCIKILGIPSWKILAVTFTNKACNEMKDRIQKMLPETNPKDLCIKTFHSFGAMVLHRFGDRIGLNSSFKIYDEDDSLALLAQIFPDVKRTDLNPYAKKISLLKDKMISPAQVRGDRDPELYKYYNRYEEALRHTGNVDFADLIIRTIELIDKDSEVQQWLHNRFKVVLVDEYQDSNAAQCELLKRVAGPDCFVCVVGDDDQSIYKFRGADVHNILSFGEYFPGAQVIKLEQNYRSTSSI